MRAARQVEQGRNSPPPNRGPRIALHHGSGAMNTVDAMTTGLGELAQGSAGHGRAVEWAVVIPTFNERDNVVPLLNRLAAALDGIAWEAIFVDDDSPDGTADHVRGLVH